MYLNLKTVLILLIIVSIADGRRRTRSTTTRQTSTTTKPTTVTTTTTPRSTTTTTTTRPTTVTTTTLRPTTVTTTTTTTRLTTVTTTTTTARITTVTTTTTTTTTPITTTTTTTPRTTTTTTTTSTPTTITTTTTTSTITTVSTTTTTSAAAYTLYEEQALAETNYLRAKHCAQSLSFDINIKTIAQTYAQVLCNTRTFTHSGNQYQGQPLGENLYSVGSTHQIFLDQRNGSIPIDTWYSEVQYYNYSSPGYATYTAHFTATVWMASSYFGLGYCCTTDNLKCYVVANYFTAGNYQGQYVENVKPATCG